MSLKAAARLLPQTLCVLLLLLLAPADAAAQAGKDAALRLCWEQFGAPVDADRNLFEVNEWYVLELKFDARSRLSELNAVPKYFFAASHPEWEEPESPNLEGYWARYLTRAQYEELLRRLDTIGPRGKLLKAGAGAIVTNMTAPYTDVYERAEVTRGEVLDLRRGEDAPTLVRYVRLRFVDGAKLNRAKR